MWIGLKLSSAPQEVDLKKRERETLGKKKRNLNYHWFSGNQKTTERPDTSAEIQQWRRPTEAKAQHPDPITTSKTCYLVPERLPEFNHRNPTKSINCQRN